MRSATDPCSDTHEGDTHSAALTCLSSPFRSLTDCGALTTQVLDPLDDANNAGKGCYRFCQVQALFRAALAAAASAAGDAADRAVASGQAGCAPSAEWNRREWAIEGLRLDGRWAAPSTSAPSSLRSWTRLRAASRRATCRRRWRLLGRECRGGSRGVGGGEGTRPQHPRRMHAWIATVRVTRFAREQQCMLPRGSSSRRPSERRQGNCVRAGSHFGTAVSSQDSTMGRSS